MISRRDFITLLGAAAATWPFDVGARPAGMPVIGFLNSQSPDTFAHLVAAFHEGLREGGYVEGESVALEYSWAKGQYDRLPALAIELVQRGVTVIFSGGSTASAEAARAATTAIPIVAIVAPETTIALGLVASLNRPGGNLTGVAVSTGILDQKRLGLLHELLPLVSTVTVLLNPTLNTIPVQLSRLQEGAAILGLRLRILNASSEQEIDAAFATMSQEAAEALLIGSDPYLYSRRQQVVSLASRYGIPTMYTQTEYVMEGGLMSYNTSLTGAYRRAGVYTARVLNGESPAEMPIDQDTTFELVINLRTAAALGLTVPLSLLVAATRVIE